MELNEPLDIIDDFYYYDEANKKYTSDPGDGGSSIDDTTASATTTYSSNKIETIKGNFSSQINGIKNEVNIPINYYEEMINTVNDKIFEACFRQDGETTAFIMFSDTHYTSDKIDNLEVLFKCINKIAEYNTIDFVVNCGDVFDSLSASGSLNYIKEYCNIRDKYIKNIPFFSILGNHDRLNNNMGIKQLNNLFLNKGKQYLDSLNTERMYFSFKNENSKMLYIFLNEYDIDSTDVTNPVFSTEQLNWLCNELKNANGYDICIFNHRPIIGTLLSDAPTITNREKIQDILNSFAHRISYNDNDFSSCSGRIVGIFTGHYHGDTMNSSLFYQSSIVNALASKDNYTQGKAEIYDRTLGTTTEIAFDVVIIGKDTGKVNYIRFGAGNDRNFTMVNIENETKNKTTEYAYTDSVKISPYDGIEVTDNTNNKGTLNYINCPTSSFKVVGDNTWKVVAFYDENKTFISSESTDSDTDPGSVNITTIPSNAKYIRISANYVSNPPYNSTMLRIYSIESNELLFYLV